MAALLSAQDLGKRFERHWVFRGVEFRLHSGVVLAITGANGSGKSTLLRVLRGLIAPSLGSVERRGTCGFAAPDIGLYPSMTPIEHLQWAGHDAPFDSILAILATVGLTDCSQKVAKQLSTGQRSRLKLSLAILQQPKILFLDEPTANLDEAGIELVQEIVSLQRKRGVCVIATNDARDLSFCSEELRLSA